MTGDPAARLHPQFAGRQVELVMEHHDVAEIELVEARGFAHGAARLVHEGLGLEQQHRLPPEPPLGGNAGEALAPSGEVMRGGDGVNRHEADIVTVEGVFLARIAEADKELHSKPS